MCSFSATDSWVVLNSIEQSIKQKIEKVGTPLKDWDIQINYGIKTGYNDAFIIDKATKEKLISEDAKSAEIIRPILRGRDIKKYSYEFADLYLLYIPWHFPLHSDNSIIGASEKAETEFKKQYPAIYNHLFKYKKQLSARNKAETGIRYEWYALQRWGANYMGDFYKQKICWNRIASIKEFSLSESGVFISDSMHFITGDDNDIQFLTALLNSKIIQWLLHIIVGESAGGNAGNADNIKNLPIPLLSIKAQLPFIDLIDKILSAQKVNSHADTIALEKEVDTLVYLLYNLTQEEIEYIEKSSY